MHKVLTENSHIFESNVSTKVPQNRAYEAEYLDLPRAPPLTERVHGSRIVKMRHHHVCTSIKPN